MSVEDWIESACIVRWCGKLRDLTGCSMQEIAVRREMLLEFCALQSLSPDGLLERCRQPSARDFYLQAARGTPATLIVQSFLIHNGINVFGDLVCLPVGEAVVTEQGRQWERKQPDLARELWLRRARG